ncbi:MarR family winged helix-turn-helix transcriptional regulator [Gymnodinialimonas sp.]
MSHPETLLIAVGTLLREFHVNERAFPSAEGQIPYSPHVFAALGFIAGTPGARATDLAEFLGLTATTASSLITRLVGRGVVEKRRHPEDGRALALYLTAEGEDLFAAIRRQDMRNMEVMLSALSAPEQAQFVEMMTRVAERVAEAAAES